MRDQFGRVRKLRQDRGGDKGPDLDLRHTRPVQRGNPGLLRLGGHDWLDALQAVARADFADGDVDG